VAVCSRTGFDDLTERMHFLTLSLVLCETGHGISSWHHL